MRHLLFMFSVAACGNSPACPSQPPPTIPEYNCDDNSLQCTYGDLQCTCNNQRWYCDDCPFQFPPTDVFQCTRSCHMDTWEWSIDCTCDEQGRGVCCGSDNLDACPVRPKDGGPCCLLHGTQPRSCPGPGGTICTCDGHWHCG